MNCDQCSRIVVAKGTISINAGVPRTSSHTYRGVQLAGSQFSTLYLQPRFRGLFDHFCYVKSELGHLVRNSVLVRVITSNYYEPLGVRETKMDINKMTKCQNGHDSIGYTYTRYDLFIATLRRCSARGRYNWQRALHFRSMMLQY